MQIRLTRVDGEGSSEHLVRDMTPEERYVKVLAWVRAQIVAR